MKKLCFFILIVISFSFKNEANNPWVGTWTFDHFEPFSKKSKVSESFQKSFQATIELLPDSTFIKTVNGTVVTGRYTFTSHSFSFLEKDKDGKYQTSWGTSVIDLTIRGALDGKDALEVNEHTQLNYSELLPVINKKGKEEIDEVIVYYRKK